MRKVVLGLVLIGLVAGLGACRQTAPAGGGCPSPCDPQPCPPVTCAPPPCPAPCPPPCPEVLTEPLYDPECCGGDPRVGTHGYGAFR